MTAVTRPLDLLRAARAGGYALPAFNAVNLETAQAVVRAAEACRAPVILGLSHNAARYAGLEPLAALARTLRAGAGVPVLVHFDHAEDEDAARAALRLGADGVMLEGSDPGALRRVAGAAHAQSAFLEAEYEVVAKRERAGTCLPADDLARFAALSGCDLLAVGLGSRHGQCDKTARLDFGRLEELAARTPLPLVLHGASGVPDEDLARAARSGVSKVNLATDLMGVFTRAARESLEEGATDPRVYLGAARDAMQRRCAHYLHLLGAAGRA